jgi:TonB-linked SusC/RagA family outer membrane protein
MRYLALFFALVTLSALQAQTITGKVTSPDDPDGMVGVTVAIKNTFLGTITDVNGNYSINAPGDTSVVVFSFIGYAPKEVRIDGKRTIDIVLEPLDQMLESVVVTALGIKRDEKALGYSVQKVAGDKVARVKELDVINALSGKVSGVNIIQADGSIGGGGSRIVIRGETSLAGNNDPLYIIDGIQGNANDIASDDIESISVLKGPAAAALYGAKAGSGVIIITSKSSRKSESVQVDFNSNITFQSPLVLPKYQNKYGQGSSGAYSYFDGNGNGVFDDERNSWGPAFNGELRPQFTGNMPWVAFPNNVSDFYQTGHIFINNISVGKGSDSGSYRFSYTNTDQKGILPNTGLAKNNLALNMQFNVSSKISLSSNISYIATNCENNKQVDVRFIPRSIDIAALKDYWVPGLEGVQQMNFRRSANNPYFELFENPYAYNDTKVIANVAANYNINDNLNVSGKYGTNYINNEYYDKHAYSTYSRDEPRDLTGYYKNGLANNRDQTAEFLASYGQTILNDFNFKLSFGGTHFRSEYKILEADAYGMTYMDIFNLNSRSGYLESLTDKIENMERNSLYGFFNIDYKGKVFLDITRRDDWSSTLHPSVNHFIYPSVVGSAVLSEMFPMPNAISFWKLRASYAQVGNDIPKPYYTVEDKFSFNSYNGLTNLTVSDTQTDPYLKPEISTGTEYGMDIRLFKNRVGLDVTYYHNVIHNQILNIPKSTTSGGEKSFTTNAGKIMNHGVELTLNLTPVKSNFVKWDMQVNWSWDRSMVEELLASNPDFSKTQKVNSFLAVEDRQGQRRGTFYGRAYQLAPNGKRLYTLSGDTRLTEATELGNYNPDWMASLSNSVDYKNLSFSFLLDLRYGGLIYNEIERKLNMYGLSEATLLNNREGIVPDGMVEENGSYRPLTMQDLENASKQGGQTGQEYWATQMEETAPLNVLVDDTYLKLRELRLSYRVPTRMLPFTFVSAFEIALVGRNVAVWSNVRHIDPETFGYASAKNDFGGSTKVPGYANSNMPSVRSYGFTLNCKF